MSSVIPDWLQPTFTLFPLMVWMFVLVGAGWALALLPAKERRHPFTVAAACMALGASLVSTIMFIIGTVSTFTPANALLGTGFIGGLGWAIWFIWARKTPLPAKAPITPLSLVEKALIAAILLAVALRFWNTAYWPFTTYDALWVYGYNGRVFTLHGAIPSWIAYYPQNVPLAYTWGQLFWGGLNDHAARAVLPYFAMGGILAVYVLGGRLFNRQVGLLAAAVWALYPHHAVWSQFGDLEVTLTFYFTATVAFFGLAWRERNWRYAAMAGLLLGGALWTKPTAGALIQSFLLIAFIGGAAWLWGSRRKSGAAWGLRLGRYAALTLAFGFPMGGMWYIRNILLGHPPLVLPPSYWQDAAQRGGQEMGWPAVLLLAALIALVGRGGLRGRWLGIAVTGLALFLAVTMLSAGRGQLEGVGFLGFEVPTARFTLMEYALLLGGVATFAWAAWRGSNPSWRGKLATQQAALALLIVVCVLPYFVTWFWSYSYHYRLSFPMVPAFTVLMAVLLAPYWPLIHANVARRVAAAALVAILALPGLWAVLSALPTALTGELRTDDEKIAQGNQALMDLVGFLRARREALGRPLRIVAPAEQRLAFFFPDSPHGYITDGFPLWLDDIAEVDYYIDSSSGQGVYALQGRFYNQILASRTRLNTMAREFTVDDKNFRFSAYRIKNQGRFENPSAEAKLGVTVGDFAYLSDYSLNTLTQYRGEKLFVTLIWKALNNAEKDYSVFVHLWDAQNQKLIGAWGGEPGEGAYTVWQGVPGAHFNVRYHTRLWQKDEYIIDEWVFRIPQEAPAGRFELRVGMFDPITNTRLPIAKDGLPVGDFLYIHTIEVPE
jgi:Dolichyl-phosphate-mannose-protein mannosyltransferase